MSQIDLVTNVVSSCFNTGTLPGQFEAVGTRTKTCAQAASGEQGVEIQSSSVAACSPKDASQACWERECWRRLCLFGNSTGTEREREASNIARFLRPRHPPQSIQHSNSWHRRSFATGHFQIHRDSFRVSSREFFGSFSQTMVQLCLWRDHNWRKWLFQGPCDVLRNLDYKPVVGGDMFGLFLEAEKV